MKLLPPDDAAMGTIVKAFASAALPPFKSERLRRFDETGDSTRRRFDGGELLRKVLLADPARGNTFMLAGEPGSGKSTLALAIALSSGLRSLYIGTEEDDRDIGARAIRLYGGAIKALSEKTFPDAPPVFIAKNRDLDEPFAVADVARIILRERAPIAIVDSINEVRSVSSYPLVDAVRALNRAAQKSGSFIIYICHFNADGDISGPKKAQHLADAVGEIRIDDEYDVRNVVIRKSRLGPAGKSVTYRLVDDGVTLVDDKAKKVTRKKKSA